MFTLQRLNVVKIVETKEKKDKLISEGFTEIVETKKIKKGKE